jgi:hypothetical protein
MNHIRRFLVPVTLGALVASAVWGGRALVAAPAYAPQVSGAVSAKWTFDPQHYPGETALVRAWHDLEAFAAQHPVLGQATGRDIDLYLGGAGGD